MDTGKIKKEKDISIEIFGSAVKRKKEKKIDHAAYLYRAKVFAPHKKVTIAAVIAMIE